MTGKMDVTEYRAEGAYRIVTPVREIPGFFRDIAEFEETDERDIFLHRVQTWEAMREALKEARAEVIALAERGVERIRDLGGEVDDANKVCGPAVARIDAALNAANEDTTP